MTAMVDEPIPADHPFWKLHQGLPRQAPGSTATTSRMLRIALGSERPARALDIGAGSGASTLVLAANGLDVVALDTSSVLLGELSARARKAGLSARILPTRAPMQAPPFSEGEFDLLWCEGAAYVMGWAPALRAWRRLLRPGGVLAATELCWTTDRPSPEGRRFFEAEYPGMTSPAEVAREARAAGFVVRSSWELPEDDWWEYYAPIERRIAALEAGGGIDGDLALVIRGERAEIELRRRHPGDYGYFAFVLARTT
jgi:SAM-dependent methyltransferase